MDFSLYFHLASLVFFVLMGWMLARSSAQRRFLLKSMGVRYGGIEVGRFDSALQNLSDILEFQFLVQDQRNGHQGIAIHRFNRILKYRLRTLMLLHQIYGIKSLQLTGSNSGEQLRDDSGDTFQKPTLSVCLGSKGYKIDKLIDLSVWQNVLEADFYGMISVIMTFET